VGLLGYRQMNLKNSDILGGVEAAITREYLWQ
jgi:hypothetical protein